MRNFMVAVLAFGSVMAVHPACGEASQPSTMIKIQVRLTGPGITPNSPAALPKTIYVADPRFARIEDPPSAREGVQKLTIISEPDAYSVNLIDKKGVHVIHQGGDADLHLPVILPFDPAHRYGILDGLEFGAELEFFKQAGAVRTAGPIINAKPTDAYVLRTQGTTSTLVVRGGSGVPVTLNWKAKDGLYTYEYIVYQDIPFDPALFAKPAGIVYRDVTPDSSLDQS